jgi:hypothetical protein
MVAAFLGSGELEALAERIEQGRPGLGLQGAGFAIDVERNADRCRYWIGSVGPGRGGSGSHAILRFKDG